MQAVSQAFLNALHGSFTPVVQVDAWYDGNLTAQSLPVVSGAVTADSSRTILTSASVVCASVDDTLAPTAWNSPLACYGSLLHVRAGIATAPGPPELVSLGWLRNDSYDSQEWWQPYTAPDGKQLWVPRGVQVSVNCSDRMATVDDAQFLTPQQPKSLTSVLAEIARLVTGLVDVEDWTTLTDAPIPKSITYSQSRAQAVQDLAGILGCVASMSPAGALQLTPTAASATPVWTVSVKPDQVPLLGWAAKGDRAGLYNAVVSSGQNPAGTPVSGQATEESGPLRFGGPFGQVPYSRNNPLLATDAAAGRDANTTLATLAAQRTVTIPVSCPPNYALEVRDTVQLELPDRTLIGQAMSITWPLGPGLMQLNVAVPRSALWS